jgi:hypothetical protein
MDDMLRRRQVKSNDKVIVREISRNELAAFETHLLALDSEDRRLRFGIPVSDAAVRAYVGRIDLDRAAVLGIVDDELRLVGAAHLARSNRLEAELGISVLPGHRGQGLGGALLGRAHTHARNWDVRALFMHCLAENGPVMHLARKQGMKVIAKDGEADAWLKLPRADAASRFGEVFAQRAALLDYAMKSQLAVAMRIAAAFSQKKAA